MGIFIDGVTWCVEKELLNNRSECTEEGEFLRVTGLPTPFQQPHERICGCMELGSESTLRVLTDEEFLDVTALMAGKWL
ncbi:hypothetical protein TNCV_4207461 [Trichonephila clavipes]|nr:hypothetical protein TNCV_4207461 [Trichonephila clavipes]